MIALLLSIRKKILLLIRSDPRESHRPCEGIRIALGLASGGHEVEVILSHTSLPLLSDKADDTVVDGDLAIKYLSSLQEFMPILFLEEINLLQLDSGETPFKVVPLSKEKILTKITSADCFFTF